jgi:hypothetical protein
LQFFIAGEEEAPTIGIKHLQIYWKSKVYKLKESDWKFSEKFLGSNYILQQFTLTV